MTTIPSEAPGRARAWVMAARPATLPAAVAPVLVGTAVAVHARHFRALPFLAALVAAILYTGGPWPLGYHGLGDVFVFIFFGLIAVTGTYYVQAGALSGAAIAAAVPVGLLVTAILVVNNVRDIETDRAAGKRTLAVRLGRRASRVQYALLVATAYVVP